MPEYEVVIYETVAHKAIVEAKSTEEAYDKGYEIITSGKPSDYETEAIGFTGEHDIYEIVSVK
jgi:hypothetical protein